MSMMIKMLKSEGVEMEERQIARIRKEIETLTYELQMREDALARLKNKDSQVKIAAAPREPEILVTA